MNSTTCLRAILRQMRIRGWRPLRLPNPPDPLLGGRTCAHTWVSRDGLDRLTWINGTLDYHNGATTVLIAHQLTARQAGLALELLGLLRPGVMDNPEWFARPTRAVRMATPELAVAR